MPEQRPGRKEEGGKCEREEKGKGGKRKKRFVVKSGKTARGRQTDDGADRRRADEGQVMGTSTVQAGKNGLNRKTGGKNKRLGKLLCKRNSGSNRTDFRKYSLMDFLILINESIHDGQTLQKTLASVSNSGRNPEKETAKGFFLRFGQGIFHKRELIKKI